MKRTPAARSSELIYETSPRRTQAQSAQDCTSVVSILVLLASGADSSSPSRGRTTPSRVSPNEPAVEATPFGLGRSFPTRVAGEELGAEPPSAFGGGPLSLDVVSPTEVDGAVEIDAGAGDDVGTPKLVVTGPEILAAPGVGDAAPAAPAAGAGDALAAGLGVPLAAPPRPRPLPRPLPRPPAPERILSFRYCTMSACSVLITCQKSVSNKGQGQKPADETDVEGGVGTSCRTD
ncbi:hypothetical protein BDV93DRAFT_146309 [Ceratobasidium sp. AG-I]|nr:hypothetical protein BDV93DRAFT_146309 [Ceratobasidium sp. AG-I]